MPVRPMSARPALGESKVVLKGDAGTVLCNKETSLQYPTLSKLSRLSYQLSCSPNEFVVMTGGEADRPAAERLATNNHILMSIHLSTPTVVSVCTAGSAVGGHAVSAASGAAHSHDPATPTPRPGSRTSPVDTASRASISPAINVGVPALVSKTRSTMTVVSRVSVEASSGADSEEEEEENTQIQPISPPGLIDHLHDLGFSTTADSDVENFAPHFASEIESQASFVQRLTRTYFPPARPLVGPPAGPAGFRNRVLQAEYLSAFYAHSELALIFPELYPITVRFVSTVDDVNLHNTEYVAEVSHDAEPAGGLVGGVGRGQVDADLPSSESDSLPGLTDSEHSSNSTTNQTTPTDSQTNSPTPQIYFVQLSQINLNLFETKPRPTSVDFEGKWQECALSDRGRHWPGSDRPANEASVRTPTVPRAGRLPAQPIRTQAVAALQSGNLGSTAGSTINNNRFHGQGVSYQCSVRPLALPSTGNPPQPYLRLSPATPWPRLHPLSPRPDSMSSFHHALRLLWAAVVGSAIFEVAGQQGEDNRAITNQQFTEMKEILAFDTDGTVTGFPPRTFQFSAERVEDCPSIDSNFYPEEPIDFQAVQYSEVQPAEVYQCKFQVSYSVSYCSFSGLYHSLNGQVPVLPPRVAYLSAAECRMAAETGTVHLRIYTPNDGNNKQVQSQITLSDLPHGFITLDSVEEGIVYPDASCAGSDFEFYEKPYYNSILYRSVQSTIVTHEGHVVAERGVVMVPGVADFDLVETGGFDRTVGRLALAVKLDEVEDHCSTAVELFRGRGQLHKRKSPTKHMSAVLFYSSGTGNVTAFVLQEEADHCGNKLHGTSSKHVYIRRINEKSDYLDTRKMVEDDVLGVEDVRHEAISADARMGFDLESAVNRLEAQECSLDRQQQQNLLAILRMAGPHLASDLLLGATVARSGAALTLLASHPFRARLRPYKTAEPNMCIEQIPASAYSSNGTLHNFFVEPVSRLTTRFPTKVHCGIASPVVQTLHSESTLTKLVNTQTNIMMLRDFSTGAGENATGLCDSGAGLQPCEPPPPLQPSAKPAGSDVLRYLVDAFRTGEYSDSIKDYVEEMARYSSHRKALNQEFLRLSPGSNQDTPLIIDAVSHLPDEAKNSFMDSVWGTILGFDYGRAFPLIAYGALSLLGLMLFILVVGCASESIVCINKASSSLARAMDKLRREIYRLVPTAPQPEEDHELQVPRYGQVPLLVAQQGQQQWALQTDLNNLRAQVTAIRAELSTMQNRQ